MDGLVSRLLFLTLFSILMWSSAGIDTGDVRRPAVAAVRRHRRRPQRTPEDVIRRQIERAKDKILSQLSYRVRTVPPRAGSFTLPRPLHHMYDIDVTVRRGAMTAVADPDATLPHVTRTTQDGDDESMSRQARLIVFGHKSKYDFTSELKSSQKLMFLTPSNTTVCHFTSLQHHRYRLLRRGRFCSAAVSRSNSLYPITDATLFSA